MRPAIVLGTVLLAQTAFAGDATAHLRYERAIEVPALAQGAPGSVCAVLDAGVFAHAASRSGDDLRVYREAGTASAAAEVPFTLLESEAEPDDDVPAAVRNLAVRDDVLSFDLAMPHQAYTAVELHLAAKDFLAQATVSGAASEGVPSRPLGQFTLFDLGGQHLPRSTELPLQETLLPWLHVTLRLWHPDGTPIVHPSPAIVQGAVVPPSRQAQTLYTTVASTSEVRRQGSASVATLFLPAHVPVERLRVVLDPGATQNFMRPVRIEAVPQETAASDAAAVEAVEGSIARVRWPTPGSEAPPVRYESLAMDATLGANLRRPALVRMVVPDGDAPLPLRSVELQMRQRTFCFAATAGARYTLRYGDAGLAAPVYAEGSAGTRPPAPAQRPLLAVLGPERENPAFIARPRPASLAKGHPQIFWVGLLSMVTLSGALAAHRARSEKREPLWRRETT